MIYSLLWHIFIGSYGSGIVKFLIDQMHPGEELDEVLPGNKVKKELILLQMPFLGLHKSKVRNNGISIWFSFVSSGKFCTCSAIRKN